MSDAVPQPTLFHRMRYTPLRDALRGRWTRRLDVEGRMERAALPAPARELIRRVVRRTRLWQIERAEVADELIAHFADGLEGGQAVEQMIASFGDERVATKLVRRAKRRNRPLAWHAMVFLRRLLVGLIAVYLLLALYYYSGRPSPRVDYVAQLNARIATIPEDQRAWPLYREAIIAAGLRPYEWDKERVPRSLEGGYARPGDPHWPQLVGWLERNAKALDLARQAARKPALGLPVAVWGREVDPLLIPPPGHWASTASTVADNSLQNVSGVHTTPLGELAQALTADAFLATRQGDVPRAIDDIAAVVGIGEQLREHDLIYDHPLSRRRPELALEATFDLLAHARDKLAPADLQRLAHVFAGPDTAADMIDFDAVRTRAGDRLQHLYTDDGSGDGRLTPTGVALLNGPMLGSILFGANLFVPQKAQDASLYFDRPAEARAVFQRVAGPALPVLVASRREAADAVDRLTNIAQANLQKPAWEADWSEYHRLLRELHGPGGSRSKYATVQLGNASSMWQQAERYLARRDGLLVGLALEAYRRDHEGKLPETLDALSPALLPRVPLDRKIGQPLRYRVTDGKPLVYSVGNDRDDDGGRLPTGADGKPDAWLASYWFHGRQTPPDGDWVMYPELPRPAK